MTKRVLSILLLTICTLGIYAQFNFELSKSLSENFGNKLITIGEDDGKVFLYDKDKLALISYDIEKDTYAKTGDKYYNEAGVVEPRSRAGQKMFVIDNYVVSCYLNINVVKGYNTSVFLLFFDKDDMSFQKKLQYDLNSRASYQFTGIDVDFYLSENKKLLSFTYSETSGKKSEWRTYTNKTKVINPETEEVTELDIADFFEEIYEKYDLVGSSLTNSGDLYAVLETKEIFSFEAIKTTNRLIVKFDFEGGYTTFEPESEFEPLESQIHWDEKNKQLHYLELAYSAYDETIETMGVYDTYAYYKLDENLKVLEAEDEEGFDIGLIGEANQNIEYDNVKDNTIGLISFKLKDFSVLKGLPVVTFEHRVKFKNGTFYPSFLVLFLDDKGGLESHSLIKRWNSNGGDQFGDKMSMSKMYTSEDAIYIVSNFNNRFEPFKDEKEFEKTEFGYLKITADYNVTYHNIITFSEANFFGITHNLESFSLSDGNIVYNLQKEPKGMIPAQFENYKHFYATTKLK